MRHRVRTSSNVFARSSGRIPFDHEEREAAYQQSVREQRNAIFRAKLELARMRRMRRYVETFLCLRAWRHKMGRPPVRMPKKLQKFMAQNRATLTPLED